MGQIILGQIILNAIKEVKSKEDYQKLVDKWNMSDAPKEIKDEAKRELNLRKSKFCKVDKLQTEEQAKTISEGSADIDDIGN